MVRSVDNSWIKIFYRSEHNRTNRSRAESLSGDAVGKTSYLHIALMVL
jgi:hypothetical protein